MTHILSDSKNNQISKKIANSAERFFLFQFVLKNYLSFRFCLFIHFPFLYHHILNMLTSHPYISKQRHGCSLISQHICSIIQLLITIILLLPFIWQACDDICPINVTVLWLSGQHCCLTAIRSWVRFTDPFLVKFACFPDHVLHFPPPLKIYMSNTPMSLSLTTTMAKELELLPGGCSVAAHCSVEVGSKDREFILMKVFENIIKGMNTVL